MKYNIIRYNTIDSTNKEAKRQIPSRQEGTVIISEEQTQGKGRLGRNWASTKGKGIWMSIILEPETSMDYMMGITSIGAAAVNMALGDMDIPSKIKWPNDIIVDGKKVCGILTEVVQTLNGCFYAIIGIGINVNQDIVDFSKELHFKASSLKIIKGYDIDRELLLMNVLSRFRELYMKFKLEGDMSKSLKICRENSMVIGKEINLIIGKRIRRGKVLDLNMKGELVVEFDTGIEEISSGEVSIRAIDGYI